MAKPWERYQVGETAVPAKPSSVTIDASPPAPPITGPASQEPPQPVNPQNAMVGIGQVAAVNTMTGGLSGEPWIMPISGGLNLFAQAVKQYDFFNEKSWTIPLLLVSGLALCCWLWRDPEHWDLTHFWMPGYLDLPAKGVVNGLGSAFQAVVNYHGLAATGASPLKPVPFQHSQEARRIS